MMDNGIMAKNTEAECGRESTEIHTLVNGRMEKSKALASF